jgi:hypothetical protein
MFAYARLPGASALAYKRARKTAGGLHSKIQALPLQTRRRIANITPFLRQQAANTPAQVALTDLFVAQVTLLILRCQNESFKTSVSLAADALSVVGIAGGVWLSFLDHQRSYRPSTLLSLYLSVLVILDIAKVRTLWLMNHGTGAPVAMTAILIFAIIALLAESVEKKKSIREEKLRGAPEEYSGLWVRTAYAWLIATFRTGYSKVISLHDLPKLDRGLESHLLHEKLVTTWDKCESTRIRPDHLVHGVRADISQMTTMSDTVF